MNEAAATLSDSIIPRVPVRQWVLSFPIPLRSLFAVHPELITPALSNARLSINGKGKVILKLKTPWADGATHITQRLAALVPRPRLHLTWFHGVLAPNAKFRSKVVPGARTQKTPEPAAAEDPVCAHSARMRWAQMLKRVFDIDMERCECGGKLKLIAVIEQPDVIEKIFTHLGLAPQPLPIVPVRREALFEVA